MAEAFPLQWPEGWPRTTDAERQAAVRFKQKVWRSSAHHPDGGYSGTAAVTFAKARDKLYAELERLGAGNVVISTNHKPDIRGVPIESKRKVDDEGVAIYFLHHGKQMAMACDRFDTAAGNMRSLGLAIEAMRQLERHGGGTMMERAFSGFVALPSQANWKSILGFKPDEKPTRAQINERYRSKAGSAHPDQPGGSTGAMAELNMARDQALREIGH
jgi:hypothetical protein